MDPAARETFAKHSSMIASITVVSDDNQSILADVAEDPHMASLVTKLTFESSYYDIDLDLLHELPNQLHNVEHLKWIYSKEAESWCARMLTSNSRLKTFIMMGIDHALSDELVGAIVRAGQLEELSVYWASYHIGSASLDDTLAAIAAAAATSEATLLLKKLTLLKDYQDQFRLGAGLIQLVQRCPLLQELTLSRGVNVESIDSVALLIACHNLKTLDCMAISFSDVQLDALVAANPPLQSLAVTWAVTSVDAVNRAASLLSRLLNATIDEKLAGVSLSMDALYAALELMTSLRDLSLAGTLETVSRATQVTNVVSKIALICPPAATASACLVDLAQHAPRLTHLHVCGPSEGVSDGFLQALAAHCPGLRHVDFSVNKSFTDAGVVALAKGCAHLHVISFCNAQLLTDASLLALAEGCPQLVKFNCFSVHFTETVLVQLIDSCRRLRRLYISMHCTTEAKVEELMLQRPALYINLGRA